MMQSDLVKDLFEQGRKNICNAVFEEQNDPELYPEFFEKSTHEEIEEYLTKLVVLAPIHSFVRKGQKNFRVLQIIEADDDGMIYVKNIEKLDTMGISIYLDEQQGYSIKVKEKLFAMFICPPNTLEIVSCVFTTILPKAYEIPSRTWDKFYTNIENTLRDKKPWQNQHLS